MKLKIYFWISAFAVICSVAANAKADEVTDWTEEMFRASLIAGASPLAMSRNAAIVQASVFDAVNGIERKYTPIHVLPAAPAGASERAAAVQAAYVALVKLYPAQLVTFDARKTISMSSINGTESAASIASGIAWGDSVANQIWAWRLTDGIANTTPPWTGSTAIGQWRPTPNAPYAGTSTTGAGYPSFVFMTPWVIASPSLFRPGPPPALASAQYATDFNEVKSKGSFSSLTRTADETTAAYFWNSASASYLWGHVALSLIDNGGGNDGEKDDRDENGNGNSHRHSSLVENARILGELTLAMADAAIGCWDAKYTYNFWRPITAIRETGDDGNPLTTPDTTWTPLFSTPAHPDYPSGHSCVSGAATVILAHEYGEHTRFQMNSDGLPGVTRTFNSFSAALEDVKSARVNAGIHFRTATEVGTALGFSVGQVVLQHAFNPVH
jgi:hypothetical protein